MRFLVVRKMQVVDTSEKDVWGACAINQGRSIFDMRGLGLEEGTCLPEPIILPVAKPCKNATMWIKNDTTI